MLARLALYILTFVLVPRRFAVSTLLKRQTFAVAVLGFFCNFSSALAVSSSTLPDSGIEADALSSEKSEPADRLHLDTVDIAKPAKTDVNYRDLMQVGRGDYYYPYHKAISPRLGTIYDTQKYAQDGSFLYLIGFELLLQDADLRSYEVGADVISNGTGQVHLSRRWILSRSRFRPFYKGGMGFSVDPGDGISAFLKYQNFQGRGSIGFEQLVAPPMSIRVELEAIASISTQEAILSLGYSWAW